MIRVKGANYVLQTSHNVAINPYPGKGELVVLFGGHGQTEPNHRVGPQVLDYHLMHYIESGCGTFHSMGREYTLSKGDCFFIFPGELVSYVSDSELPWSYRWIGFRGNKAREMLSEAKVSPETPVITITHKRVPGLFGRIERVLGQAKTNCDLSADGYMRLLIAELAEDHWTRSESSDESLSAIQRQVEQAIRWLTLQYSQQISIEQMAQTLGYHRTHLSKMFKQHTGMSPMSFLLKIRMERSRLLLTENLTIEQIASSVGFPDPLYFSKQFKKWYGSSPTEYRAMLQGKELYDCSQ
jgi:AraC-like DNA-binding protein